MEVYDHLDALAALPPAKEPPISIGGVGLRAGLEVVKKIMEKNRKTRWKQMPSSAQMNSLAKNHVTYIPCGQRHNC
jgi:hypothetical protein